MSNHAHVRKAEAAVQWIYTEWVNAMCSAPCMLFTRPFKVNTNGVKLIVVGSIWPQMV